MKKFFDKFDTDANGSISFDEFADMAVELGIAPMNKEAAKGHEKRVANHASIETPV